MTGYKVEDSEMFQEFVFEREIKEATINTYKHSLQLYVDFTGKTLEDLIEEAEKEQNSGVLKRKRKIKEYFNGFKKYLNEVKNLKGKPYSENTKRQLIVLIQAFYSHFDIDPPKPKKRKRRSRQRVQTIDELPSMEEIQDIMEVANSLYRATITLGLSSGMGASEIVSLTYGHFYDAIGLEDYPDTIPDLLEMIWERDNIVPLWRIERIKTEKSYFTFSSPENVIYILKYLREYNIKYPDFEPKPNDKLFRSLKYNRPIKANSLTVMYERLHGRLDQRSVNDKVIVRSHNLRKRFASTLEVNKMPYIRIKWLMGHDVPSTDDSYFYAEEDSIRSDYVEILDQLTTDKVKTIVVDKYEEVRQDLDQVIENQEKFSFILERGTIPESISEYISELEEELGINRTLTEEEVAEILKKSKKD